MTAMNQLPDKKSSVDVLLFSVLRESVGSSFLSFPLDEPITAGVLLERLAEEHPSIRSGLSCVRVAVNQEYVGAEHVVRAGDEVALITPVSGG